VEVIEDCDAKSIDGRKKKQQGDSNAESKAAKRAHEQEEIIRRIDAEAAAVREKLMKAKHQKKQCDKTTMNDAAVVGKVTLAFNRATIVKLTSNLQDALVEKRKLLGLEAQVNISEEKRAEAEKALGEEKILTKNLWNQLSYCKKCLAFLAECRNVVTIKESEMATSLDGLISKIEDVFGVMKGAHNATKAAKLLELISTGLLFSSGGSSTLESMHRDFVKNILKPWKLIYASDMSPACSV
jgi:hypothetical protein